MVSLDLSTTNIILTVAVVGLLMFFIVLLIRLNPSTDKKENSETEIEPERTEPLQTPIVVAQDHPSPRPQPPAARIETPRPIEKPVIAVGPALGGGSAQIKEETLTPAQPFKDSREIPRPPERTVTPAPKSAVVPVRRDCLHHFGYLRTFPKNSPIPDECFGCEKIVDCLVSKKSNGKNERSR